MDSAISATIGPSVTSTNVIPTMHAGAREVRHEQHETPVVAVGHDPGRHRQDDVRDHAHRPEQSEHDRIAGFAVDHDEQRDDVQPVADRADELAAEQPRQRPVAQDVAVGRQEAQESALGGLSQ